MSGWVLVLAVWSFDRLEPPFAVLVDDEGAERVVERARLPPEARPGDRLATPTGPVIGVQRVQVARLQARIEALCRLAPPDALRQRQGMRPKVSRSATPGHPSCVPSGRDAEARPLPR